MIRLPLVVAALGLAVSLPAHATSVIYYDDDTLFDMADVVALGVVWRREVDRRGYPRTEYEIQTEECFKGCRSRDFIIMNLIGAPADDLGPRDEWFMGQPSAKPGARIIVYLKRNELGQLELISLGLSQYTLSYSAKLKRHMAHREIDQVAILRPARPGREASGDIALPRDRFASDVIDELRAAAKKRGHK